MSMTQLLYVRAGGQRCGLPLEQVLAVIEPGPVQAVPGRLAALRGITEARGRMVSLLNLGVLLGAPMPPGSGGGMLVIARVGGREVALEVDEIDTAPAESVVPLPEHAGLQTWASGAVRRPEGWVPILNLEGLAARWRLAEEEAT